MKKIVTAMNNPKLNQELQKIKEFETIKPDIAYQDGIFELLEKTKNINIIIINELLYGKLNIEEIIEKIQKINNQIKIMIILEKENTEKINQLKTKQIKYIFIHQKNTIEEIIKTIHNINEEKNIEKEIEEIKNLILEKNKNKINFKKIQEKIKHKKEIKIEHNKIISISGTKKSGKSIFVACLAREIKNKKIKTLIIDFNFLNSDQHSIFGSKKILKKINNNKIQLNQLKIKMGKNLDLISGLDLLFANNKINIEQLNHILEQLKKEYEIILIDTSSECFLDYNHFLLEKSDTIIFITEANLIHLKEANYLLKIINEKWNIEKNKINLLFNKYNKNAIDEKILKTIFFEYPILGKINLNSDYNLFINKNMKNIIISNKIKKEYQKIINKIIKPKKKRGYLLWKTKDYKMS